MCFFLICGGFVLFLTNYIIEYYDIRGYFKIIFLIFISFPHTDKY